MPDPIARSFESLRSQLNRLTKRVNELENELEHKKPGDKSDDANKQPVWADAAVSGERLLAQQAGLLPHDSKIRSAKFAQMVSAEKEHLLKAGRQQWAVLGSFLGYGLVRLAPWEA